MNKKNLADYLPEELAALAESMGDKKFRGQQIFRWIARGVSGLDEMTDLSAALREKLGEDTAIYRARIAHCFVSELDGTRKYVLELHDGNTVECVLMSYKHGFSACLSTQAGCRMGCRFCASTGAGFGRNLSAGEILDQILVMQKDAGVRISNLVLMGIGEPLDNYEQVLRFLRIVNHPQGLNIGARHISLSTCGLVPEINRLAEENLQVTLSVSLHATTDAERDAIMPVNRRYPVAELISACRMWSDKTHRRIVFEYALIAGVNDTREHAQRLSRLLRGMLCHVNLIPVNPVPGTTFRRGARSSVQQFAKLLEGLGVSATVRRELGADIQAACGQLRREQIAGKTDATQL